MKQYKTFKHPSGAIETVKQGWSWPGFFFTFIWAMSKKMWGIGVGAGICYLVLERKLNSTANSIGWQNLLARRFLKFITVVADFQHLKFDLSC